MPVYLSMMHFRNNSKLHHVSVQTEFPTSNLFQFWTNIKESSDNDVKKPSTGWERLTQNHSSARFCFKLSLNSN